MIKNNTDPKISDKSLSDVAEYFFIKLKLAFGQNSDTKSLPNEKYSRDRKYFSFDSGDKTYFVTRGERFQTGSLVARTECSIKQGDVGSTIERARQIFAINWWGYPDHEAECSISAPAAGGGAYKARDLTKYSINLLSEMKIMTSIVEIFQTCVKEVYE